MARGRASVSELRSGTAELTAAAVLSFALGLGVDFLFNGVAVKLLSKQAYSEAWFFIYAPVFLTIAATHSSFVARSRWRRFTRVCTVAVLGGMIFGHFTLIGHRSSRTYRMILVSDSPTVLLRSEHWPQILFLRGEKIQNALLAMGPQQTVIVTTEVVSDYGCIRSALLATVAGIDVKNDAGTEWVWRLNKFATTFEKNGPGNEDLSLPWCKHVPEIKMFEGGPDYWRPWDDLLIKLAPGADRAPAK